MTWPASDAVAGAVPGSSTACSRNRDSCTVWCWARKASRSAPSAESRAEMDASQAARSSGAISSAWSRYGLRTRHRSGLMAGMGARLGWRRTADGVVQIEAALLPGALDRPLGDAAHPRDLAKREAAEELQIDDLGEGRFDLGELVERVADQ